MWWRKTSSERQRRVKSNTTSGCFNVFQPREGHRRDARARIPAAIARTLCKHITQVQHKYTTSVWVFVLSSCLDRLLEFRYEFVSLDEMDFISGVTGLCALCIGMLFHSSHVYSQTTVQSCIHTPCTLACIHLQRDSLRNIHSCSDSVNGTVSDDTERACVPTCSHVLIGLNMFKPSPL